MGDRINTFDSSIMGSILTEYHDMIFTSQHTFVKSACIKVEIKVQGIDKVMCASEPMVSSQRNSGRLTWVISSTMT